MVAGRFRSRTFRRVKVKLPGGRVVVQYRKRKPSKAVCTGCGDVLKGVARARPSELRKLSKTERRPERPYGGVLCSRCMRQKIKEAIKSQGVMATAPQ